MLFYYHHIIIVPLFLQIFNNLKCVCYLFYYYPNYVGAKNVKSPMEFCNKHDSLAHPVKANNNIVIDESHQHHQSFSQQNKPHTFDFNSSSSMSTTPKLSGEYRPLMGNITNVYISCRFM